MPSSEEESQWLVGSGGGLAPSGGSATKTGAGERGASTRSGLYTEEMTTQPASVATAGVNSASADSAEHDLIDSTADATLLAQFHEDAIKQVRRRYRRFRISEFRGTSPSSSFPNRSPVNPNRQAEAREDLFRCALTA